MLYKCIDSHTKFNKAHDLSLRNYFYLIKEPFLHLFPIL